MKIISLGFRKGLLVTLAVSLLAVLIFAPLHDAQAATIPTFEISSVVKDSSVTITTANFPANQTFTVRIGAYGTLGVGGTVVDTTGSGAGGSFSVTYPIPAALKGAGRLAIRMDNPAGFFAYNWFWNGAPVPETNPIPVTGGTGTVYTGIPTFAVSAVTVDSSVTITTTNFPANKDFTVRMGAFGTLGVGGTVVGTTSSGTGGTFTATYNIPAALKGAARIAIRMDAADGFYAYNWFTNSTAPDTNPIPVTGGTGGVYSGIPTFSITSLSADSTVTIKTSNFPANQDFIVRLGAFGTLAVGGTVVGTTPSGAGGTFTTTYSIPAGLKGSSQIAIRLDSADGFFAYNWFWNK